MIPVPNYLCLQQFHPLTVLVPSRTPPILMITLRWVKLTNLLETVVCILMKRLSSEQTRTVRKSVVYLTFGSCRMSTNESQPDWPARPVMRET